MIKNIFDLEVTTEVVKRINSLKNGQKPAWGKMTVGQMLAHCSVTYEMIYTNDHPKPTGLKKFFLKNVIKKFVVSYTPYKPNSKTGDNFLIVDERYFETEKKRLLEFIVKTQKLGERNYFDNKESHSFGELSNREWNNMFYKHIDHHLKQFEV